MNEPISLTYHQAQAVAELSAKVRETACRHKGYGYSEQARVVLEIGNPYSTEPNLELHGLYVRVEGGGAPVPLFAKELGQARRFDAARLPARDENGHVQHPDMDGIGWDEFNMGPSCAPSDGKARPSASRATPATTRKSATTTATARTAATGRLRGRTVTAGSWRRSTTSRTAPWHCTCAAPMACEERQSHE